MQPHSLHRYAYANCDPVNNSDPSGNFSLGEILEVQKIMETIRAMSWQTAGNLAKLALKSMIKSAFYGGILGGIDSWLGGNGFWSGVLQGATIGAVFGLIGPLFTLKFWLLTGCASGFYGAGNSIYHRKWSQAVFRFGISSLVFFVAWKTTSVEVQAEVAPKSPTIEEAVGTGIPDDTLIHISPVKPENMEGGKLFVDQRFVEFGRVKAMKYGDYLSNLIGGGGDASTARSTNIYCARPGTKAFQMLKSLDSSMQEINVDHTYIIKFYEFHNTEPIAISEFWVIDASGVYHPNK